MSMITVKLFYLSGTQSIVPNARLEDAVTEERITQILSDAQAEMQAKQQVHEVQYMYNVRFAESF